MNINPEVLKPSRKYHHTRALPLGLSFNDERPARRQNGSSHWQSHDGRQRHVRHGQSPYRTARDDHSRQRTRERPRNLSVCGGARATQTRDGEQKIKSESQETLFFLLKARVFWILSFYAV